MYLSFVIAPKSILCCLYENNAMQIRKITRYHPEQDKAIFHYEFSPIGTLIYHYLIQVNGILLISYCNDSIYSLLHTL